MQLEHLRRVLDPLNRRIRTMLMRGNVSSVDDSQDLQVIQITRLDGETIDDCDRVGQYGLTSVPPAGSEVIVGQIGSNADHQVILGVDDKSRPHPLTEGQTCLYDGNGTTLMMNADGTMNIAASSRVTITAPAVVIIGDVQINGTLIVSGDVTLEALLNGHTP